MAAENWSGEHSVTQWIAALQAEQSIAGERLWERYVEKLARLARKKLAQANRRATDEEDIVVEVFTDFLNGVKDRRFERLCDRNDLWQILTMLTERKVVSHLRHVSPRTSRSCDRAGVLSYLRYDGHGLGAIGLGVDLAHIHGLVTEDHLDDVQRMVFTQPGGIGVAELVGVPVCDSGLLDSVFDGSPIAVPVVAKTGRPAAILRSSALGLARGHGRIPLLPKGGVTFLLCLGGGKTKGFRIPFQPGFQDLLSLRTEADFARQTMVLCFVPLRDVDPDGPRPVDIDGPQQDHFARPHPG